MNRWCWWKILTVISLLVVVGNPVFAQDITLKSADGTVELTGELLAFNGETYLIKSKFGEMTLNALGLICIGHACPDPGQFAADITMSGSSDAVNDLLPGLIEDFGFNSGHQTLRIDQDQPGWTYFMSDNARVPVARLQATPLNSTDGLAELMSKGADIAITSRLANAAEIKLAGQAKIGDISSPHIRQVLAIDALVAIVSAQNPVNAISQEDLARIYSGEISNWAELGGYDGPIRLFSRRTQDDIAQDFHRRFFPSGSKRLPIPTLELATDVEISNAVSHDPFAIGITGFAGIRNAKALAISGACGMQHFPTAFSLQSGDYPLARIYYIYRPEQRLPIMARNFLKFLDSDVAQRSIAELGFVGQGVSTVSLAQQQNRVADAIAYSGEDISLEELQGFVKTFSRASRLSSTFRFNDSSIKIDARSARNIRVLAQMIEVGDFDGKKLIFAGFSDSQGGAAGNRRISRQRAGKVASLVKAAATRANISQIEIQVLGMGEVSPLACNDSFKGRRINRRVEIWVK